MPFDSNGNATVTRDVAVSGQTIQAAQVNVPFSDIQAMLSQLLLRSGVAPMTGNMSAGGFRITNAANGTSDGDYVTLSQLNDAISSLASSIVPTGARCGFFMQNAPAGWIVGQGGTIGNTSSGATARANPDTKNLFTLFWNNFSNTVLPIYTSGGVATTRGASADADWAANKALRIFDLRDEYDRGADAGRGLDLSLTVGAAIPDIIRAHAHGVVDPGHFHSVERPLRIADNDRGELSSLYSIDSTQVVNTSTNVTNISIQPFGENETRPRTVVSLHCIKL